MHPVAGRVIEASNELRIRAARRVARGGTVALAMLGLFANEGHAPLIRLFAYGAVLAVLALMAVEATSLAGGKLMAKSDWMHTAGTPALRGAMNNDE